MEPATTPAHAKNPTPNRALSGALSGRENAALWRPVWFCCRVSLFYCGSYLNRKQIISEFMPMDGTMFYVWEVQTSNFLGRSNTELLFNKYM
jgi:hypothetical protein